MDIRIVQITIMLGLLAFGAFTRDFSIDATQIALTFVSALAVQAVYIRRIHKPIGYLSAIITAFGISLLLRSSTYWVHPLAAAVAIGSKFILRVDERHVFNPANLGVVVGMLCAGSWVSPGQWGSDVAMAFWMVVLGSVALFRVGTAISTFGFLIVYFSIWALHRVVYLGYEWLDLFHQFQSGALLLFAFFMISDPKTAPVHVLGKLIQAVFVGVAAYLWHYWFYFNNGFICMLFVSSLFVPLLNKFLDSNKFDWNDYGGMNDEKATLSAAGAAADCAA